MPQYLIPQHLLSALMFHATRVRRPWFKNRQIRWFIRRFGVDMSQALEPVAENYPDFNSFFTRALRPDARPRVDSPGAIVCPVDGTVSQLGQILEGTLVQAKGRDYSLPELMAGDTDLANLFQNGTFATLYLSPRDYHRIHMPLDGALTRQIYVPGRLFAVNQRTTRVVPRLFARNERVITLFETEAGPMAMVLVGAIFVGGIETVWSGAITPARERRIQHWSFSREGAEPVVLDKGQEMGRFNMGSTVIILFPKGRVSWSDRLGPGVPVRVGQQIGRATGA